MKRLTCLSLLTAMSFCSLISSTPDNGAVGAKANLDLSRSSFLDSRNVSMPIPASKNPAIQALPFKVIDLQMGAVGDGPYSQTNPFYYEPESGGLFMMRSIRLNEFESSGKNTFSGVSIFYSYDNGATWKQRILKDTLGTTDPVFIGNPSLVVTDAAGKDDKFKFVLTARELTRSVDADNLYQLKNMIVMLSDGNEVYTDQKVAPASGGAPDKANWINTKSKGLGDMVYVAGQLYNPDDGPEGYYGILGVDLGQLDFTNDNGVIPPSMFLSEFSPPVNTGATSASNYTSNIEVAIENDGDVYVCTNNFFSDNNTVRVPAVARSTDKGVTWSSLNKMPYSLLEAYQVENGATSSAVINQAPYQQNAFIVTGDNEWSYFYRLALYNVNDLFAHRIVEAFYKNGLWGLRTVADLLVPEDSDVPDYVNTQVALEPVLVRINNEHSTRVNNGKLVVSEEMSALGNEVEVAVTADGQDILVKWVDKRKDKVTLPKSVFVLDTIENASGQKIPRVDEVTSIWTTDVFVAHRGISETSWSAKVNVTDDETFDKCTKIPSIIPDLEHVPIMLPKPTVIPRNDFWPDYPEIMNERFVEGGWDHASTFSTFNVFTVSVEEPGAVYGFDIKGIRPNPAGSETEIVISNDAAGNVNIELYDVIGNKVADLYSGFANSGSFGLNINTERFLSGTYYVRMSKGGSSLTKQLVVVK